LFVAFADLREAIENHGEEHFDPMNAVDRKIVHTLLKNIEGVRSYSRGEEPHRCVVVGPVE